MKKIILFSLGLLLVSFCFDALAQEKPEQTATNNDNSKVGPITRPIIVEIAPNTYFINEFGMDAMYLVTGKKSALVIDTGTGFCDFKGIIEKLTDLPYQVALTHGHPDHAGGMNQFDTVYMNLADTAMAFRISYAQRVQYGEIMRNMKIGYKNVWGYTSDDVIKTDKRPFIKPLHDGQVFDLGDRKVTVYDCPGHTPGSVVFLDPQSRILFSGDAANGNVRTGIPVSTTIRYLLRLKKLQTNYDRMFTGHISYAGTIDVFSQKLQVLDDIIEAFRSVLRGDAKTQEVRNHLFPERTNIVAVYGMARVGFNPDKLWEKGEEHIIP